jgi:hypothetical protein
MPRLRNIHSGAVVSTSEATAARLGAEWVPADEPEPKRQATKKAAPKSLK